MLQAPGTYGVQVLIAGPSMAASVIVARALGPAGRGQYVAATPTKASTGMDM